jgi:hypothetical protein
MWRAFIGCDHSHCDVNPMVSAVGLTRTGAVRAARQSWNARRGGGH